MSTKYVLSFCQIAALKEHLKKVQEEEQRLKEEAEKERLREEERIRILEEQVCGTLTQINILAQFNKFQRLI